MRRLILFIATALLTVGTLAAAAAADPSANAQPIRTAPASGSDLPDLGSPAATVLSKADEYRLGAMIAHELRQQNALLEDPEVSEYVNNIGDRLASQSAMGAQDFHYFVVRDTSINAFAVTGGYVFINAGLILATATESELAGVMAHETAHITQHHIARMLADQSRQSLPTIAALIGAILLGAIGGGQAAEGAIAATQGMAVQHQINFTRDNEWEADRVGIGYLAGAGFDPYGMGSMFETMARRQGLAATYIPAMLIDHPMDSDRVAEQHARAAQFPPVKVHDSESYELIRERVRVLTATGDTDVAAQYAAKIAHGGDNLGNRYGECGGAHDGGARGGRAQHVARPVQQRAADTRPDPPHGARRECRGRPRRCLLLHGRIRARQRRFESRSAAAAARPGLPAPHPDPASALPGAPRSAVGARARSGLARTSPGRSPRQSGSTSCSVSSGRC